jgi:hypothetical protein
MAKVKIEQVVKYDIILFGVNQNKCNQLNKNDLIVMIVMMVGVDSMFLLWLKEKFQDFKKFLNSIL